MPGILCPTLSQCPMQVLTETRPWLWENHINMSKVRWPRVKTPLSTLVKESSSYSEDNTLYHIPSSIDHLRPQVSYSPRVRGKRYLV